MIIFLLALPQTVLSLTTPYRSLKILTLDRPLFPFHDPPASQSSLQQCHHFPHLLAIAPNAEQRIIHLLKIHNPMLIKVLPHYILHPTV